MIDLSVERFVTLLVDDEMLWNRKSDLLQGLELFRSDRLIEQLRRRLKLQLMLQRPIYIDQSRDLPFFRLMRIFVLGVLYHLSGQRKHILLDIEIDSLDTSDSLVGI